MVAWCSHVRKFVGITLLLSAPYAPEQNGVSERENHTVVDLERSVLSVSGLPKPMWAQACGTVIEKSPRDMRNGHVMNMDHLRVFGTECYVYIPKQFRKKFYIKVYFIT
jgi:hypothetical protein